MTERRPPRVLIVEDSPTQAKKLELVLRALGMESTLARDGTAGLALFHSGPFDLVLSDVQMPGLSGYELCRRIKSEPAGRSTPVVLLTALNRPLDIIRGLESGADNYISKPFHEAALADRIGSILAGPAPRAQPEPPTGDHVFFMGQALTIAASKEQILNFLGSTFEDFVHARRREFEGALAREKQNARAETYRVREELVRKEKETLRQSREFLQSTLDALATRIAILDEAGVILAVNTEWRRHDEADTLAGIPCAVGFDYLRACLATAGDRANDAALVGAGIAAVIDRRRDEFSREYFSPGKDGARRWFSVRVTRFGDDGPTRVVVAHEDVTPRKLAEEQLLHDAYHDALTGLPNRALFTDRLAQAVARSKRNENALFAVLFLDLDGFKVINDSLGHTVGDELLVTIGRRLGAGLRECDTVARFGGDEFALLVNDLHDHDDALALADRLQTDLEVPFQIGEHEVFTSASIGIALSTVEYDHPVDLLRDADTAMYRAKALGKAHRVVFDKAMHASVWARLRLETDLRRAIERREFALVYQPIVALATGRVAGFEALVRWNHPERGLVAPNEFIPAAEETGLIIPLDHWVVGEACRQMRDWQDKFPTAPPLTISVNLSSVNFSQPNLLDTIDRALETTGIDPTALRLEITESLIMGNTDGATALLRQFKERGISLSMDDFGTGYSSLSYLHKFSFDFLKIDRSFVGRIGPNGEHSEIVETIVALAHHLGMRVVAEGVETDEQRARLRALDCEYGQGYFFARPLAPDKVADYLAGALDLAACGAR